jgi:multicomponent Na+:H+ antiporter subunit B
VRSLSILAVLFAGAVLFYASPSLPPVGDPDSPASSHVSPYYIEHSLEDTKTPNLVTTVVTDYRGYDTLGETTVIMTAGLACLLILGFWTPMRRDSNKTDLLSFGSPVLDAAARLLVPYILLFALYVLFHGHHSPGGGFQGGTLLAAGVILVRLVRGRDPGWGIDRDQATRLACWGAFFYFSVGLVSFLLGENFLDYSKLPLPLDSAMRRNMGILGVEIGVTVAVAGTMILIFDCLHASPREDSDAQKSADRAPEGA